MVSLGRHFLPLSLRGYQRSWLVADVVAGTTLSAVAIPEVMGYTSIAQTPVATGLYTVIFPTAIFALLGASRLLVVGADSATAAILSAGLGAAAIAGVTPDSEQWVAYTSFIALICGVLLVLARLFRLGFLGDFLSASVLIGFLTGVGVQVASGQIPDMLGIPKGSGGWLEQQWQRAHLPGRHQRDDAGVRSRHSGHHCGVQAVRSADPRRDRRGRAPDRRLHGDRCVHARRGCRGIRGEGFPADRSAERHRPGKTGKPAPQSHFPASS
jgi:hypothetical protein